MIDMGSIQAAAASLKAAVDISTGLLKLKVSSEVQTKVVELQREIIAAQVSAMSAHADQTKLVDRVRQLEEQIRQFETWEAEKERYCLTEIGTGAYAYVLKESVPTGDPIHCICSQCYEKRQKSILQTTGNFYGDVTLTCPRCKAEVHASESHENYPFKRDYAQAPREQARARLEDCPICQTGKLKVVGVKPHPIFGDVGGLQVRTLKCDSQECPHTEEREYDPNKGSR